MKDEKFLEWMGKEMKNNKDILMNLNMGQMGKKRVQPDEEIDDELLFKDDFPNKMQKIH